MSVKAPISAPKTMALKTSADTNDFVEAELAWFCRSVSDLQRASVKAIDAKRTN
jgi:hypothetical protein